MRTRSIECFRSLVCLSLGLSSFALAADPAPRQAYTTLSELRNIAIAPSGKFVAYQLIEASVNQIIVVDLSSGDVVLRSKVLDSFINNIQFVNDEFVAVVLDRDPWSNRSIRTHDPVLNARGPGTVYGRRIRFIDLKELSMQKNFLAGTNGDIVNVDSELGAIYVPWEYGALTRYTIDNGTQDPAVASGTSDTMDWYMGSNREPLAREDYDFSRERHIVYAYRDGESNILLDENVSGRDINVVALSPAEDSLIYLTRRPENDRMTYHTMSLIDGSRSDPLFSRHIGKVLTDSRKIAFAFERDNFPDFEYAFLNEKAEDLYRAIKDSLPGLVVRIIATTDDFEYMVVRVEESWSQAYYLFFSYGNPRPIVLGKENTTIAREQSAPRSMLEFRADDGRMVRAYLTQPDVDSELADTPLIVLATAAREARSYQWMAQYFASRGFTVVQPIRRGIDYGSDFMPQGDANWGDRYVSDINDTIRYLQAGEINNASQLCIVGTSIGGYAALAAAADEPERFSCAVSVSGLADLSVLMKRLREDRWHYPSRLRYTEVLFGVSGKDRDAIFAKSPMNRVTENYPPTLLMYYEGGNSVFDYAAKDMRRELRKKGRSAELVKLPGFSFGFSEIEARPILLEKVADFVEQNID